MKNNEKIRVVKWEDWKINQDKRRPENLEKREAFCSFCSLRTLAFSCFFRRANSLQNTLKTNEKSPKISLFFVLLMGILVSLILIVSLGLVSARANETNLSNETNASNGINIRNLTNIINPSNVSVGKLEGEIDGFDVFEEELANLTSSLSELGYDWLANYNLKNRGIL